MSFRPAGRDIAVITTAEGKLDVVLDSSGPNKGNPRFGNDGAHALITRIFRRKGKYYWDRTGQSGTDLHLIKDDRQSTPSKMQAAVEDGCDQVRQAGKITRSLVQVRKIQARYEIGLAWRVPGEETDRTLVDNQGRTAGLKV